MYKKNTAYYKDSEYPCRIKSTLGTRLNYLLLVSLVILSWASTGSAQSLSVAQSLSISNPDSEEAFEYIISVSCNSTTANCHNTIVSGYLPPELDFLNFSDPLPSGVANATYDLATRYYEITFDEAANNSLAKGSTIQLSIQSIFPGGSIAGSTATNDVTATSTNATNATNSISATLGPDGWQITPGDFPDDKYGDSEQLTGGYQYWGIKIGNIGFSDIDNYQIFDVIPSTVTLDQIRTPEILNLNHAASIYYKRSDDASTWHLWLNHNLNSRTVSYVSSLGLPAGIYVTEVRMDLGTVPASALYNPYRYSDGFNTDWILYGDIDDPLADGVTYTNCADYVGDSGGPITDQDCISTTINSLIAEDRVGGSLDWLDKDTTQLSIANIGDTIIAGFTFYSSPEMVNDILGGVQSIVLPAGMYYVPGSLREDWNCTNFDGQSPVIQTATAVDGRQIVRFVYDSSFGNEFNIEPSGFWDGCGFLFDVVVGQSTFEGINTGYYYYNATGSTHTECMTTDVDNYLGGYALDYCREDTETIQIVRAPSSAGVRAEKFVTGTLDAGMYSQFPATATTVPGGLSNYRIVLTNPNETPIDNIEIIDILPHIGDTNLLDENTPRFSEWRPNLAEPITAPSGITVFYTTVNNPCRDELAGSNPTPFPSGCTNPSWTTVAPSDITDVTALKFDLYNITLNQNDDVTIEFEMRAPVNAPTDDEIAWNSFAYVADNATSGSTLLPTEAIKVGIQTTEGTVPIAGDFVWDDLNGNGFQDSGEPGIDGVRVALIEDTNGNGTLENSDDEYTWTITANGGQYIFSDFPAGDYFIEFTNFPSGYNATHRDVGSNDGLDSDGPISDLITFEATSDFNGIDMGLFFGSVPPLWSCTTGLMPNSEFENNFNSWADLGNTSITSDAYVGNRAMLINGGQGGRGQILSVTPGETYRVSFYAKMTGSEDAIGGFNVKDVSDNTIYTTSRGVYDNTYEYHSLTMTVPANGDRLEIFGYKEAGSGAAYFDAFCLELINDICGGGGEPNNDGDPICDRYDIDDDNDGIRDVDESVCINSVSGLGGWFHDANSTTGDIWTSEYVASMDDESYGLGITASLVATGLRFSGLDATDLADAISKEDYIEYSLTTTNSISSIYLDHFSHGKWSDGPPTFDATPDNYGYDLSILISDDGFSTSSVIADIYTIDHNIDPTWYEYSFEADDNYYVLRPSTTFTFRVYFYNKTTDLATLSYFDDFAIYVKECTLPYDSDSDDHSNHLDLDSDNDGLLDLVESGHSASDSNNDGIIDNATSQSGINGFFDDLETTSDIGSINYAISNSENSPDGIYDPYEIDSDDDGCYDSIESEIQNLDPDSDGIAGSGAPTTQADGTVQGVTYTLPLNTYWQDHSFNICNACRTAMTNPHIMYYRRN